MNKKKIEWNKPTDFPEVLNPAQNGFSVDVMVYFPMLNEHSIGWFHYSKSNWLFLSNQDYKNQLFFWRYFDNEYDIPELWIDVVGYEGIYKISSFGKIMSFHKEERILKHGVSGNGGYDQVKLVKDGVTKSSIVSRLVALHFVDNPNNYPEVNHVDEDKRNNFWWNLEWCTRVQNINHGTRTKRASESCKKKIVKIDSLGNEKVYDGIIDVEKDGFIASCVQRCCSGERKSHANFKWRYLDDQVDKP